MDRLGSIRDGRLPRGIENRLGKSWKLIRRRDHTRRTGRIRLFGRGVRLKLEVVLVEDDRSRELVREGIEGIPLCSGIVSDEDWERNTGLRTKTRLDHTVERIDQDMGGSEMNREINIRVGDGRALGERGVSKTLGNGGSQEAIVLPRLISEPEEAEEDESAKDGGPSGGLISINQIRVQVQYDPGDLVNTRIVRVYVFPGDVWCDWAHDEVVNDNPSGQGDGKAEINGG